MGRDVGNSSVSAKDDLIVVLADADATHPERCELWALLAHTFADDLSFLYWICWDGDKGGWSGPKQSDKEASIIRGY